MRKDVREGVRKFMNDGIVTAKLDSTVGHADKILDQLG